MMIKNEWLLRYNRWCWGKDAPIPTVKAFIIFNVSFYALVSVLLFCIGSVVVLSSSRRAHADTNYHNDLIYLIEALKESNRIQQKQNEILKDLLKEVHDSSASSRARSSRSDLKGFDDR